MPALQSGKVFDVTPLQGVPAPIGGAVIPGVTINATPACAGAGSPQTDQYVPGAKHTPSQGLSSGGFSLTGQAGAPNANGTGTQQISIDVPTPIAPTVIDSWAAVLE
jgi:hypothetical protein